MNTKVEQEIWKDIDTSDINQVSNFGRVKNKITGKVLSQHESSKGYKQVHIIRRSRKKGYTVKVHSLVMRMFGGERPKEYVIDHKDGDKNNNHIDNLHYVTNRYNTVKQLIENDSKPYACVVEKNGKYQVEYRHLGKRHRRYFEIAEDALRYYYNTIIKIDRSVAELLKQTYTKILT